MMGNKQRHRVGRKAEGDRSIDRSIRRKKRRERELSMPFFHERLQTMFPPKYFDSFSPEGGCSEGLDAFRYFLCKLVEIPAEEVCFSSDLSVLRVTIYYY